MANIKLNLAIDKDERMIERGDIVIIETDYGIYVTIVSDVGQGGFYLIGIADGNRWTDEKFPKKITVGEFIEDFRNKTASNINNVKVLQSSKVDIDISLKGGE